MPEPRRPGRRLTLFALALTALASLLMLYGLRHELVFALRGGPPLDVGAMASFQPAPEHENRFVRGEGSLTRGAAVRYRRPLEPVSYRLAQVADNPRIWVQVTVPEELEGPHFVPPTSFVGRLVPMSSAGLRMRGLREAMARTGTAEDVDRAWLLIDAEGPNTLRWAIALAVLFIGFAAFSLWGLVRLLVPVKHA